MVKSLNYLNNVLAKIEAQQAGAGEGLMLNEQGFVAECTGDNVFTVKHGEILTLQSRPERLPVSHAKSSLKSPRNSAFESPSRQ